MSLFKTTGFAYRIAEDNDSPSFVLFIFRGRLIACATQEIMGSAVDIARQAGMEEYIVRSEPEFWTVDDANNDYHERTKPIAHFRQAEPSRQ